MTLMTMNMCASKLDDTIWFESTDAIHGNIFSYSRYKTTKFSYNIQILLKHKFLYIVRKLRGFIPRIREKYNVHWVNFTRSSIWGTFYAYERYSCVFRQTKASHALTTAKITILRSVQAAKKFQLKPKTQ